MSFLFPFEESKTVERDEGEKKKMKEEEEAKLRYGNSKVLVWIFHGKQETYGFVWISRDFYEFQT